MSKSTLIEKKIESAYLVPDREGMPDLPPLCDLLRGRFHLLDDSIPSGAINVPDVCMGARAHVGSRSLQQFVSGHSLFVFPNPRSVMVGMILLAQAQ